MATVVILDSVYSAYDEERSVFEPMGIIPRISPTTDEQEIIDLCRNADGICVNLAPMPASVINELDRCRVIARYGVGYDNVDVDAAAQKGIWVANVTDYCGEDVSDQAMALLLSCARKTARRDAQVRAHQWAINTSDPVYRIKGKTFGFLGFGMIARIVNRKLKGFEPGNVLAADPFIDSETVKQHGAELVDFDTVIRKSDFISIHMPLNEKTRHIISDKEFKAMKPTAILINTSRGPVIDEEALVRALETGWINSAGIDVFEQEPLPENSRLKKLENITLSDHTGWYSEESLSELKTKTARNVRAVLEGSRPDYPVNEIE